METMTMDAPADAKLAEVLGPATDSEQREENATARLVSIARKAVEGFTTAALEYGQVLDDLIAAAQHDFPQSDRAELADHITGRVEKRVGNIAPEFLARGKSSEYRKAYKLAESTVDDAPEVLALSWEVLRVLNTWIEPREATDDDGQPITEWPIRSLLQVVPGRPKVDIGADYRAALIGFIKDFSAKPRHASVVRKALADWEAGQVASRLSDKAKKAVESRAEKAKADATKAKRAAFLDSIPTAMNELGITPELLTTELAAKGALELDHPAADGSAPTATPAFDAFAFADWMDSEDKAEDFATALIRRVTAENAKPREERSGHVSAARVLLQRLHDFATAENRAKSTAVSTVKPALNDSPGVNVLKAVA